MRKSMAWMIAASLCLAAPAAAQQPNITGLAYEPLDLYPSTAEDAEPVGAVDAGELSFPVPVKAASGNGMLQINVDGRDVWVIADDVETDSDVSLRAGCEPEMKGATVSFGARGLGEGCE